MHHRNMGSFLFIWLLVMPSLQEGGLPLREGRPTARGVESYVDRHGPDLIKAYEEFVGDSLFGVEIMVLDPGIFNEEDSMELGYYYPHEIYIALDERFEAYELAMLDEGRRNQLVESNCFVKATIIHELTHAYIFLIARDMKYREGISVHPSFPTEIWVLHSPESYGATFLEEGLCEYMSMQMGEIIPPPHSSAPANIDELKREDLRYRFQYKYAAEFLTPFLDTTDFRQAVRTLLHNAPPSLEEILDPQSYYSRLQLLPLR